MNMIVVSAAIIISVVVATPSGANWFHNPHQNINRNIGSAPNPTPQDIRVNRLPIVVENKDYNRPSATGYVSSTPAEAQLSTRSTATQNMAAASPPR